MWQIKPFVIQFDIQCVSMPIHEHVQSHTWNGIHSIATGEKPSPTAQEIVCSEVIGLVLHSYTVANSISVE